MHKTPASFLAENLGAPAALAETPWGWRDRNPTFLASKEKPHGGGGTSWLRLQQMPPCRCHRLHPPPHLPKAVSEAGKPPVQVQEWAGARQQGLGISAPPNYLFPAPSRRRPQFSCSRVRSVCVGGLAFLFFPRRSRQMRGMPLEQSSEPPL